MKKGACLAFIQTYNGKPYLLMGLRTFGMGRGEWTLPGGGYEHSDKFLAITAIREFGEETGMKLTDKTPGLKTDKRAYVVDIPFLYRWKTFLAEGKLMADNVDLSTFRKASSEFLQVRFFALDDLPGNTYHETLKALRFFGKAFQFGSTLTLTEVELEIALRAKARVQDKPVHRQAHRKTGRTAKAHGKPWSQLTEEERYARLGRVPAQYTLDTIGGSWPTPKHPASKSGLVPVRITR